MQTGNIRKDYRAENRGLKVTEEKITWLEMQEIF